jgi:hypothetical protein
MLEECLAWLNSANPIADSSSLGEGCLFIGRRWSRLQKVTNFPVHGRSSSQVLSNLQPMSL